MPALWVTAPEVARVVNEPVLAVVAPTVPLMLKLAAVPVMFVPTSAEGVPRAGVTRVGEVARTLSPVPVFVTLTTFLLAFSAKAVEAVKADRLAVPPTTKILPVPTFRPTDVPVPLAAKTASTESKSVLIFVPQVSVDAPTSGLVSNRLVVVESAMFYPYAAICQVSLLSAIGVQLSLLSLTADQVSDVSEIGDQLSLVSLIADHVSDVSDSASHFRRPSTAMADCADITSANDCRRVAATDMEDAAVITTDWLTITEVLTVITPKSSINIWISGTRTAFTAIVLASTAVALAIATRRAAADAPEADAAVAAPMAYRTPDTATLLALEAVADATATLVADTDVPLEAATVNDADLTTLAAADAVLAAETENAPRQMRFASTATALVAAKVAAPRLTP